MYLNNAVDTLLLNDVSEVGDLFISRTSCILLFYKLLEFCQLLKWCVIYSSVMIFALYPDDET
jgi:hypothetical protein